MLRRWCAYRTVISQYCRSGAEMLMMRRGTEEGILLACILLLSVEGAQVDICDETPTARRSRPDAENARRMDVHVFEKFAVRPEETCVCFSVLRLPGPNHPECGVRISDGGAAGRPPDRSCDTRRLVRCLDESSLGLPSGMNTSGRSHAGHPIQFRAFKTHLRRAGVVLRWTFWGTA